MIATDVLDNSLLFLYTQKPNNALKDVTLIKYNSFNEVAQTVNEMGDLATLLETALSFDCSSCAEATLCNLQQLIVGASLYMQRPE